MSHFATPGGSSSSAEDELARVLDTGVITPRGDLWPVGLVLLAAAGPRLVVVVIAATLGFKADERWAW